MKTTEMLDKIKEGQKAYALKWGVAVKRDSGNIVIVEDGYKNVKEHHLLSLSNVVLNTLDWEIEPRNIPFFKAMELLKNGETETITSYHNDRFDFYHCMEDSPSFLEISEGIWFEGEVTPKQIELLEMIGVVK